MPAGPRGPDRETGLDVGWQRDRDRVDVPEQRVEVGVRLDVVPVGQRLRLVGIAAPDPDKLRVGMPVQPRRLCLRRTTRRR